MTDSKPTSADTTGDPAVASDSASTETEPRKSLAERAREQAREGDHAAKVERVAGGMRRQRRILRMVRLLLVISVILVFVYFFARFERFKVQSNYTAMRESAPPGSVVFLDVAHTRLPMFTGDDHFRVDDVVAHKVLLPLNGQPREFRVLARVVGRPGQTVRTVPFDVSNLALGFRFTIDDQPIDGGPVPDGWQPDAIDGEVIPPNHYFLLVDDGAAGYADMRNGEPPTEAQRARQAASAIYDSRMVGPIAVGSIYGKLALFWQSGSTQLPADAAPGTPPLED